MRVIYEGYSAEEAERQESLIKESMENLKTLMQDVKDAKLLADHLKLIQPKSKSTDCCILSFCTAHVFNMFLKHHLALARWLLQLFGCKVLCQKIWLGQGFVTRYFPSSTNYCAHVSRKNPQSFM